MGGHVLLEVQMLVSCMPPNLPKGGVSSREPFKGPVQLKIDMQCTGGEIIWGGGNLGCGKGRALRARCRACIPVEE